MNTEEKNMRSMLHAESQFIGSWLSHIDIVAMRRGSLLTAYHRYETNLSDDMKKRFWSFYDAVGTLLEGQRTLVEEFRNKMKNIS